MSHSIICAREQTAGQTHTLSCNTASELNVSLGTTAQQALDNIETSASNIETSATNIETSASNIETSASNIETSASNIESDLDAINTSLTGGSQKTELLGSNYSAITSLHTALTVNGLSTNTTNSINTKSNHTYCFLVQASVDNDWAITVEESLDDTNWYQTQPDFNMNASQDLLIGLMFVAPYARFSITNNNVSAQDYQIDYVEGIQ